VVAAQLEKRRRILYWAGALLGFVFLILTQSRTGAISGFLALASYLTAVCSRFTKIATAYGLGIFICFVLLISVNGTPRSLKAAMSLGREESTVGSFESFNGRTDIWDACANYVARRPVTGYGFGGFWNENHIAEISARNHWGVGAGHSAYLDYLLQLGAVGLITYILTLFVSLRRAFRFHSLSRDPAFAFCGALLVLCAVEGFLESTIMTPTSPLFICMVAVTRLALEAPPRKVARQFIDRGRSTLMPRLVYDGEKISLG
jgi:O-antigen ligase